MKHFNFTLLMTAILTIALAWSPFLLDQAKARGFRGGGGGAVRGGGAGGFSGGSFRGGGGYAQGPRGGTVAQGPRGGTVAQGPRGGVAARGPGGAGAAQLPAGGNYYRGSTTVNRNVTVNQGWGAWGGYYRPGAVAAGVAAGVAIGATVAYLPPAYQTVVVNSQTYYVANGAYYQSCYQGAEVSYCVVSNPYR